MYELQIKPSKSNDDNNFHEESLLHIHINRRILLEF